MKKMTNNIDMKKKYCVLLVLTGLLSIGALAQEQKEMTPGERILAEADPKNPQEKKIRLGVSWNQYWATLKGTNLQEKYFWKPSMGFNLRAEYYPVPFLGIGVGAGIQMRGAGIINPDKTGGGPFSHPWEPNYDPNDPDSTYRERLRFNTFEIPITVLLRTPKDVIKGVRLSGAAGVVLVNNYYAIKFFHKPEDGFHEVTNVEDEYIKSDLAIQLSGGAEINAGSCVLQIHLVYSKGTKNVYTDDTFNGRMQTFGFRVAWLY